MLTASLICVCVEIKYPQGPNKSNGKKCDLDLHKCGDAEHLPSDRVAAASFAHDLTNGGTSCYTAHRGSCAANMCVRVEHKYYAFELAVQMLCLARPKPKYMPYYLRDAQAIKCTELLKSLSRRWRFWRAVRVHTHTHGQ